MTETINIELENLITSQELQARTRLDPSVVEEYAEAMMSSTANFPPIDVWIGSDESIYLIDGFHRVEACRKIERDSIRANVIELPNYQEAVWWAAGANQNHGLRRTNLDKLRALELVVEMADAEGLSDREVARRIGVSHTFVSIHRSDFSNPEENQPEEVNVRIQEQPEPREPVDDGEIDDDSIPVADLEEHLKDVAGQYEHLASSISECLKEAEHLAEKPEGWSLNWNALRADLSIALDNVVSARPYKICPYCSGEGCNGCRHTGWVGKALYDMAPDELK